MSGRASVASDSNRKSFGSASRSTITKTSRDNIKRFSGIKSAFSTLLTSPLISRTPPDMRIHKLPSKGFFMPGDDHSSITPSILQRHGSTCSKASRASKQSSTSFHSRVATRSIRSVYSVCSVRRAVGAPDIFVTQPSNHGRRYYAVHRARSVTRAHSIRKGRHVRHCHPTVTAVIPGNAPQTSQETLLAPSVDFDRTSLSSIPKTADMNKDFPGEVNVKEIARKTELNYENAKATVDGVRPKTTHLPICPQEIGRASRPSDHGPTTSSAAARINPDCAPRSIALVFQDPADAGVRKHRHNALLSLCGGADVEPGASREDTPQSLAPRPQHHARQSVQSDSFVLAAEGATFLDNRKSYVSIAESYTEPDKDNIKVLQPEAKLQYLAYSPGLQFAPASVQRQSSPRRVDYQTSRQLRQLYERIEQLEDGLEEVDGTLQGSLAQATRVQSVIMDARIETFSRPTERPRLVDIPPTKAPKRLSMIDNGFPVLDKDANKVSVQPMYTKRSKHPDEIKLHGKDLRRKSNVFDNAKDHGKHMKSPRTPTFKKRSSDSPLFTRMLAKLSLTPAL